MIHDQKRFILKNGLSSAKFGNFPQHPPPKALATMGHFLTENQGNPSPNRGRGAWAKNTIWVLVLKIAGLYSRTIPYGKIVLHSNTINFNV